MMIDFKCMNCEEPCEEGEVFCSDSCELEFKRIEENDDPDEPTTEEQIRKVETLYDL